MGRKYRRRGSSSSILRDTLDIMANSPWYMAVVWGLIFFVLLYFVIPSWLHSQIEANLGNKFFTAIEFSIGRRIHWVQWLGIASAIIALYFSVRNYFLPTRAERKEKTLVGLLARIFSRRID